MNCKKSKMQKNSQNKYENARKNQPKRVKRGHMLDCLRDSFKQGVPGISQSLVWDTNSVTMGH